MSFPALGSKSLPTGASVVSVMVRVMLSHLGLRKTMLIKAGIDAFTLSLGFILIKECPNPDKAAIVLYDKKFLTSPEFWSIVACMGLCNLGFPAPYFYLPTYAKQNVPNLTEIVRRSLYTTPGFFKSIVADGRSLCYNDQRQLWRRALLRRVYG
jgi:hypothetical protein